MGSKSIASIEETLDRLHSCISSADAADKSISEWTVGQHIEHCCLGMKFLCETLISCSTPPPRSKHPIRAFLMLASGRIPRGRGNAPKAALPSEDTADSERLEGLLENSRRLVRRSLDCSPKSWVKHFVFGVLKRNQVLKFISVHNRHHLRIIADIVSAKK